MVCHFAKIAPKIKVIDYARLDALQGDVLVNCTPVGMFPKVEAAPVSAEVSFAFNASVDLIYNPAQTLFLKQAAEAGLQPAAGRDAVRREKLDLPGPPVLPAL